MKHLKLFQADADYQSFVSNVKTPNVSFVEGDNLIYYNPQTSDISGYKMVDLGLPSGLKWANMNVGATSPEDPGLYFQWGDTQGWTAEQIDNGEKEFEFEDYWDANGYDEDYGYSHFKKYDNGGTHEVTIIQPEDDSAKSNMGEEWRMPTASEIQELIDNTTHTYIDVDGNELNQSQISNINLMGVKLTGSNGNSIFIPTSDNQFNLWSGNIKLRYYTDFDEFEHTIYDDAYTLFCNRRTGISSNYSPREYPCNVRGVHK